MKTKYQILVTAAISALLIVLVGAVVLGLTGLYSFAPAAAASPAYQTESNDKGDNFGQFDLHRHQLNGVRDNFYFAPDSAEGKRQKQRSFNTATFFSYPPPHLPPSINGTEESLQDLA